MNNKVACDKCSKKFQIKVKTRKLPLGIEEIYFICPHCKEKYIGYYTNLEIRKKQKEINKMWEEYRKLREPDIIDDMMLKITKFKAEIKADMEELKKEMLDTQ